MKYIFALSLLILAACASKDITPTPFPALTMSADELGQNEISQYLRTSANWNQNEDNISIGIKDLLLQAGKSKSFIVRAKSIGMNCQKSNCMYTGSLKYHLDIQPQERLVLISILLQVKGSDVIISVHKTESNIPN